MSPDAVCLIGEFAALSDMMFKRIVLSQSLCYYGDQNFLDVLGELESNGYECFWQSVVVMGSFCGVQMAICDGGWFMTMRGEDSDWSRQLWMSLLDLKLGEVMPIISDLRRFFQSAGQPEFFYTKILISLQWLLLSLLEEAVPLTPGNP